MQSFDVVIAGGGMVGLALALPSNEPPWLFSPLLLMFRSVVALIRPWFWLVSWPSTFRLRSAALVNGESRAPHRMAVACLKRARGAFRAKNAPATL